MFKTGPMIHKPQTTQTISRKKKESRERRKKEKKSPDIDFSTHARTLTGREREFRGACCKAKRERCLASELEHGNSQPRTHYYTTRLADGKSQHNNLTTNNCLQGKRMIMNSFQVIHCFIQRCLASSSSRPNWEENKKNCCLGRKKRKRRERETPGLLLEIELEGVWIGLLATSETSSNRPTILADAFWLMTFRPSEEKETKKREKIYPCRETIR